RKSPNSFDVAQDMLNNEAEDNMNSRPDIYSPEVDVMEKLNENQRKIKNATDVVIEDDANDNALFVLLTSQAEQIQMQKKLMKAFTCISKPNSGIFI
ncbi:hypothetical protein CHS0354_021249, partial [Potamilus streckersoni]